MKSRKWMAVLAGTMSMALLVGCADTTNATQDNSTQGTAQVVTQDTVEDEGEQTLQEEIPQAVQIDAWSTGEVLAWESKEHTTVDLAKGSQTITKSGIYELTGTLTEGQLHINVDDAVDEGIVYLVLNDAHIASMTTTPLYIESAKEVVMIVEKDTTNTVTQGSITTEDESFPSAAIYSKTDLNVVGEGTLAITTAYNDGLTSKDTLLIEGPTLLVESAGDGIVGKDLLGIQDATIQITAGKDGLRATNDTDAERGNIHLVSGTYHIMAANDGIQAENTIQIEDGSYDIASGNGYTGVIKVNVQEQMLDERGTQGGMRPEGGVMPEGVMMPQEGMMAQGGMRPEGAMMPQEGMRPEGTMTVEEETEEEDTTESMKAIKAGAALVVEAGDFTVSAYEDAIHSNGDMTINGGTWSIDAGDDGIHADGHVTINGGTIAVNNSFEGIEGNDITITEGKIVVTSTDDGVNVASKEGLFEMHGGTMMLFPGNDGVDSNGDLTLAGGTITVDTTGINERNSAIDSEGVITHTGGTVVDQNGTEIDPTVQVHPGGNKGTGGRGMGQTDMTKPARQQ